MIEGYSVQLGDRTLIVPPLTLKALRRLSPSIKNLASLREGVLPTDEQFGIISEIVTAALNRNYPDLTQDSVEELLDTGNLHKILFAVMHASGLEKNSKGEDPRP